MHEDKHAKKSLGQHWLEDEASLEEICETADLDLKDTVLEIGPGKGALTEKLIEKAKKVIAVEFDKELAKNLPNIVQKQNLVVVNEDCLKFDYSTLPKDYIVVANIPYYLTSNLLRVLSEHPNPPSVIVLLIQKEVAERVAAKPGKMSLLSVTVQYFYQAKLGLIVSADKFNPAPKVDSQVVKLVRRPVPLFDNIDKQKYFNLVKAGFSQRRKKLRSSLSAGLRIGKDSSSQLLEKAKLDPNSRPQELSLQQWYQLYKVVEQSGQTK